MHDASVLVAGRAVITVQAATRPKPPGAGLSVTLSSHIFRRVPVVLASGERLGSSQIWAIDSSASYPLEVVRFPRRDLANAMTLHVTLVGGDEWADPGLSITVQLQLTFAEAASADRDWCAPALTIDAGTGPSHRLSLPALTPG